MQCRPRRVTRRLAALALPGLFVVGVAACGSDDDASPSLSPEATAGREISARAGCAACHGADGQGGTGPAWAGSLGSEVELDDGTTVVVDEAYLTQSIAEPQAQVHQGSTVQMPQNQLTDDEIAQVVAYIVALDGTPSTGTGG